MNWLKEKLSDWKVSIALVGGVVIIATVFGTCTYEAPVAVVDAVSNPAEIVVTADASNKQIANENTNPSENNDETHSKSNSQTKESE